MRIQKIVKGLAVVLILFALAPKLRALSEASCELTVKAEDNGLNSRTGKPPGLAVIFSDVVPIAAFGLEFVDGATKREINPLEVSLAYGWRWWEYPYPDHIGGAWSEAGDILTCSTANTGSIEVPSFEVRPRGWYKGKYTKFPFSKTPSFTGIDISAKVHGRTARVTLNARDSRRLSGKKVVVAVNCQGDSQVSLRSK